ncbi:hypothetical protein BSZ19_01410 [Bradyrhizobium japonicum]|uniref:Uncharacterized protein n=1 Tax=Bradyrhizobium japonicum TaxID=375 RepID=A0A1Y2K0R3_BRAJP|nr:hypothetical protein BSZ19_01410 [Bradyrhizobium japonicum]
MGRVAGSSLRYFRFHVTALALLASGAFIDTAAAQSCTVAPDSSVTLTSGACAIDPATTLTGTPAVHASTTGAITTNNVNINPFDGGSVGGLADTDGMIIFSSDSSINGNWSIGASAQSGGQIVFQSGSAVNPAFGGGGTALLADGTGSLINATGLTVNLNGAGNNVAGRATNGATIDLLNSSISYAAGGGGNTGLWATGSGSQISSTGTTISMPGGGGNDVGVRADASSAVTLTNNTITVDGSGGGEKGLLASGSGSVITASGTRVAVSSSGGGAGGQRGTRRSHQHDDQYIRCFGARFACHRNQLIDQRHRRRCHYVGRDRACRGGGSWRHAGHDRKPDRQWCGIKCPQRQRRRCNADRNDPD